MPKTTRPAIDDAADLFRGSFTAAQDAHRPFRDTLDEKEAMLVSKAQDALSAQAGYKSRVQVGALPTILLESTARVMAQLPTGKVRAITKRDRGKSELMQMVLERYILPNATFQWDHLTKFRLWDLYSKVYGAMPLMYFWSVTDTYVGPDCALIPIRDYCPQPGKVSDRDCDYAFVRTFRSVRYLKQMAATGGWDTKTIDYIVEEVKNTAGKDLASADPNRRSFIERNRHYLEGGGKGDDAIVELVTKYEAGENGHWITRAPDFEYKLLRDIPNPHKNAKIPVILKQCFPLIDSIWGLGDMERGKSQELALNSALNLTLDGMKMALYPPYEVNVGTGGVKSLADVQFFPGQRIRKGSPAPAVTPMTVNPQGIQTFEVLWQVLKGNLLNLQGTTDTSVSQSTDPGMGKTPQALQQLAAREASRDNWDRHMMESAIEELYNCYIDLVVKKQSKPIDLHLFDEEIAEIQEVSPDVVEVFDSSTHERPTAAKATVKPDYFKNAGYRFYLDSSTTLKKDQVAEHQALTEVLMTVIKAGQAIPGLNIQELAKRWIISAGVSDPEKIFRTDPQQQEQPQVDPKTGQPVQGAMPPMPTETTDGLPAIPGLTIPGGQQGMPVPLEQPQAQVQDPDVRQALQELGL